MKPRARTSAGAAGWWRGLEVGLLLGLSFGFLAGFALGGKVSVRVAGTSLLW